MAISIRRMRDTSQRACQRASLPACQRPTHINIFIIIVSLKNISFRCIINNLIHKFDMFINIVLTIVIHSINISIIIIVKVINNMVIIVHNNNKSNMITVHI